MRKMSKSDWAATTAVLVAALAAIGTSGTAYAAVAGPLATTAAGVHLQAPPPPHRFHSRFHTLAQCQAAARHDHPTRPGDWDCRRGSDRNNPFEYWGV